MLPSADTPGTLGPILGSRFFFAQAFFKSLGSDLQDQVAHLELGLSKKLLVFLTRQEPGQRTHFSIDGDPNLVLEILGFTLLLGIQKGDSHDDSLRCIFLHPPKSTVCVQTLYQLFSCSHRRSLPATSCWHDAAWASTLDR